MMYRSSSRPFSVVTLTAVVLLATAGAWAQSAGSAGDGMPGAPRQPRGDMPADYVPPLLQKARDTAGIDDKTGQYLPRDIELIESTGRRVTLGEYFDGQRPVIIQLAYYRCPKLCGEITQGMVTSMRALAQELGLGEDYQVLTVSFDSREPVSLAAANKDAVVDVLGRTVSRDAVQRGWSFFVGEDEHLKPLTQAMGYRFGWLAEVEQYSHPAAIVVCTPDGKISRYLYGASYDTTAMRLGLINASQGTITPSLKDQFILTCFEFDPKIGKYTPTAIGLMRLAGVTTIFVLAGLITFMVIAERRGRFRRHRYRGMPAEGEPDVIDEEERPRPPRTAFSG